MFYDLNVPWAPNDPNLARTILFLHELGYTTIALNYTLPTSTSTSNKPPSDPTCPIRLPLPSLTTPPKKLTLLTRLTIPLSSPSSNPRVPSYLPHYSILALRPLTASAFQFACTTPLPITLISLDLSVRHPYHFRASLCRAAIKRGVRFEISYSEGLSGGKGAEGRRNLIANARELVRACGGGGRGVVLSSGAGVGAGRAPMDVVNLGVVWGMGQEMARDGVGREAGGAVRMGAVRREGRKGIIEVVYGGEKSVARATAVVEDGALRGKRKADDGADEVAADGGAKPDEPDKPLSKRQAKKLRLAARNASAQTPEQNRPAGASQAPVATKN